MYASERESHHISFEGGATGSNIEPTRYKTVVYPFGRYEIMVKLGPANEFIGIEEVRLNRDFLSYQQRIASTGFHDVEEFYRE